MHFVISHAGKPPEEEVLKHLIGAATLSAMAFFTLLPAMHERYLIPAVVLSLAYSALTQKHYIVTTFIALVCGLNMVILLDLSGSDLWVGLS